MGPHACPVKVGSADTLGPMNTTRTRRRIGVMDGDGIGPEIVPVARDVVSAAGELGGIEFDWVSLPLGVSAIKTHGRPVPEETLEALDDLDIWVLGHMTRRATRRSSPLTSPRVRSSARDSALRQPATVPGDTRCRRARARSRRRHRPGELRASTPIAT